MTTYTIKPIEWIGAVARLNGETIGYIETTDLTEEKYRGVFLIRYKNKKCETKREAKSFIETSYKEFVEQLLEKV